MGTTLLVRVTAPTAPVAHQAAEAAIRAVERVDDLLSTWRDDTELARLNRATVDSAVALSPDLATWLREAGELRAATRGAFDPAVGALVDAWRLREGGAVPDAAAFAAAHRATGWERFRFGPATATRRDARAWIDSGAFGKGAALRAARDALVAAGATDAFLNFGGQVLALRADPATPWEVPIAHPRVRTRPATTLLVADGSVATSGQSEQTVVVDGGGVGHILDPRSGQPVTPWGSVSVVEQDPLRADALATALFVMGPEAGWAWAERHAIAALFVVDGGATVTLRATSALDAYGARAASKGTRR